MSLINEIDGFKKLETKAQLDQWELLLKFHSQILEISDPKEMIESARALSILMYNHRMLMASSKAYEGATNIDKELCKKSLELAKIGFENQAELIPFLEDSIYYSQYLPDEFSFAELSEYKRLLELKLKSE